MRTPRWVGALGLALLLAGCGDKEGEARSREQQARIADLQAKVDMLIARLGTPEGGNPEEDLKKANAALAEANQRVNALRTELEELTKERPKLEAEYKGYQRKYKLPE